jgi:uncharacterized repeat protein (TIGR03803 family)
VRPAYKVLYSFKGGTGDGDYPEAGLLKINGTLYGTTAGGGAYGNGEGTVFAITPSGTETVLHSFGGSGDGEDPEAGLINVNGTLYGTTQVGGSGSCSSSGPSGCGTVFSITPSGKETVLHSFGTGSGDGEYPIAGLINVNGTLYGTTSSGGAYCSSSGYHCGTVFAITTFGKETVLHSFPTGSGDGEQPRAGLINVKGKLYGTTADGGAGCDSYGCGTVFKITTSGAETVLYTFGASGDGYYPDAGLTSANGTLYGTTDAGGASAFGTVFSVTLSGRETVLHSFGVGSGDGRHPDAALLNVNGTLYGTTKYGGERCRRIDGCGTVFSITTSGTETVLFRFKGKDGAHPYAGFTNVNGTLYGTTGGGGANHYGTVFSLSP